MKRQLSLTLVCALAMAALVGCSQGKFGKEATAARAEANVLRYPIPTNPTSLDSANVQDGDTLDLLQQIYEGLVGWNEKSEPVGLLAESWDVSPDGTSYTFHLRQGVKFHNGREVKAEDVKWSIERAAKPALASPTIDAYLSDIVGLTDMVNGKAQSVAGITVPDDKTVVIKLKQPTPYFLGKLTYLVSAVLPKEVVPADGVITNPEQMVGTGPFKIDRYDDKQLVVLKRNDDYWGGAPKLIRIERPVMLEANTRLTKYQNGEVDLVQLERQDLSGILAKGEYKDQVKYFDRPALYYVAMNQLVYAPFKDKRVRQAFAMCIDRDRIVTELMGGVNTKAESFIPPGIAGYRESGKFIPYNPEEGKKLLAAAGFPGGKGLPPLVLNHREGRPDVKLVAEAVASQIKAALGVDVRVQPMEWQKYLSVQNAKKLPFYHMRWAADYLDPQNFISHMLATYGPENKMGYSNPQFDALCRQADTILDMDKRVPLYQQAEDIALQDAAWVPVYFQRDIELQKPGVKGMRESLFGHLPHTTTEVTR